VSIKNTGVICASVVYGIIYWSMKLCGEKGYEYLVGNTADMSLNAYATKSILGEAL